MSVHTRKRVHGGGGKWGDRDSSHPPGRVRRGVNQRHLGGLSPESQVGMWLLV